MKRVRHSYATCDALHRLISRHINKHTHTHTRAHTLPPLVVVCAAHKKAEFKFTTIANHKALNEHIYMYHVYVAVSVSLAISACISARHKINVRSPLPLPPRLASAKCAPSAQGSKSFWLSFFTSSPSLFKSPSRSPPRSAPVSLLNVSKVMLQADRLQRNSSGNNCATGHLIDGLLLLPPSLSLPLSSSPVRSTA